MFIVTAAQGCVCVCVLTFSSIGCVPVCMGSVWSVFSSRTAETAAQPEQFSRVCLTPPTLHQAWKPTHAHTQQQLWVSGGLFCLSDLSVRVISKFMSGVL